MYVTHLTDELSVSAYISIVLDDAKYCRCYMCYLDIKNKKIRKIHIFFKYSDLYIDGKEAAI